MSRLGLELGIPPSTAHHDKAAQVTKACQCPLWRSRKQQTQGEPLLLPHGFAMFTNASGKDEGRRVCLKGGLNGGMKAVRQRRRKRNVERGIRGTARIQRIASGGGGDGLRRMRRRSTGPEDVQLDAERNCNGAEMLS